MTHQFHCSLILILILCLLFTSILFPPKRKHIKKKTIIKKKTYNNKKKKKPFCTTSCVYCWYISSAHQFHQNVLKFLELHQFQVRERERERERERSLWYNRVFNEKETIKLPCIHGWCRYCLTFPILLYIAASQKQKLEKKPIHILWYYKYFPKKIINLFPKIYASRII